MSFVQTLQKAVSQVFGGPGPRPAPPTGGAVAAAVSPPPSSSTQGATTKTPVSTGRVLLIHGYSASGKDLEPWKQALSDARIVTVPIEVGNYISLNNEVTIKDLGEAFDRALRLTKFSDDDKDDAWTFDAIVHSTGMLVVRQWLVSDPFPRTDPRSRVRRLKHLVGLAPATFGSPQAKQGRSFLGALVKGSKQIGPDFLNAGDWILDGLELGSSYTWALAHQDMLCAAPFYEHGSDTPYVAVFIGNMAYEGIAQLDNPKGSDGTVRWAGCSLNTRKVSVDLRRQPRLHSADGTPCRYNISPWINGRLAAPMIAVEGRNHGTLVSDPDSRVVELVGSFLKIAGAGDYEAWEAKAVGFGQAAMQTMNAASTVGNAEGAGWQQLMVHVIDDHGDPVSDYNLQLYIGDELSNSDDPHAPDYPMVPLLVDTYSGDSSYRCFYIRLSREMLLLNTPGGSTKKMWLEVIASSGSKLIEYEAYTGDPGEPQRLTIDHEGGQPVKLDITSLAQGQETLLYPYTTTLLEIYVEREPLPLNAVSSLFNFLIP